MAATDETHRAPPPAVAGRCGRRDELFDSDTPTPILPGVAGRRVVVHYLAWQQAADSRVVRWGRRGRIQTELFPLSGRRMVRCPLVQPPAPHGRFPLDCLALSALLLDVRGWPSCSCPHPIHAYISRTWRRLPILSTRTSRRRSQLELVLFIIFKHELASGFIIYYLFSIWYWSMHVVNC
jgi:hypothetical protein